MGELLLFPGITRQDIEAHVTSLEEASLQRSMLFRFDEVLFGDMEAYDVPNDFRDHTIARDVCAEAFDLLGKNIDPGFSDASVVRYTMADKTEVAVFAQGAHRYLRLRNKSHPRNPVVSIFYLDPDPDLDGNQALRVRRHKDNLAYRADGSSHDSSWAIPINPERMPLLAAEMVDLVHRLNHELGTPHLALLTN